MLQSGYSPQGLLSSVDNQNTPGPRVELTSSYSALGSRKRLDVKLAGADNFRHDYLYDALERQTEVKQTALGSGSVLEKRATFAYDAIGQFDLVERWAALSGTLTKIVTSDYGFDTLGRVTSLSHQDVQGTSQTIASYTLGWNTANQLTTFTPNQDGASSYSYDGLGQVTGAEAHWHQSRRDLPLGPGRQPGERSLQQRWLADGAGQSARRGPDLHLQLRRRGEPHRARAPHQRGANRVNVRPSQPAHGGGH